MSILLMRLNPREGSETFDSAVNGRDKSRLMRLNPREGSETFKAVSDVVLVQNWWDLIPERGRKPDIKPVLALIPTLMRLNPREGSETFFKNFCRSSHDLTYWWDLIPERGRKLVSICGVSDTTISSDWWGLIPERGRKPKEILNSVCYSDYLTIDEA